MFNSTVHFRLGSGLTENATLDLQSGHSFERPSRR